MNDSITSTASPMASLPAIRKPDRNLNPHRSLDELLDAEEALATQGLIEGARGLGHDALDVLNVSRHARRSPLLTTLFSACTVALLFGLRHRPRRQRRRSMLLPLLFRFAGSTFFGAAVNQFIKGKRWPLP